MNTSLVLLTVPKRECILRRGAQSCTQDFTDRIFSPAVTFHFFFGFPFILMPGFLSVVLIKEGGTGTGISVPIVKVNTSLSPPGDKSLPHVSGNIAAFHSDLSLDKSTCFLQLYRGGSSQAPSFRSLPPSLIHLPRVSLVLSDGPLALLSCPWVCLSRDQER